MGRWNNSLANVGGDSSLDFQRKEALEIQKVEYLARVTYKCQQGSQLVHAVADGFGHNVSSCAESVQMMAYAYDRRCIEEISNC